MASIVSAGTTSATALNMSADTSGVLQLASNNGTVALTISTAQVVSFTNPPTSTGGGGVSTNTAFGTSALAANTSGANNTASGYLALATNVSGSNNSAFGLYALRLNTGSSNSAFGVQSLDANTGSFNSAFGQGALQSNTTASNNTAVGYQALYTNTTSSGNTAVGYQALYTNLSSANNTALGFRAGNLSTSANNVFIGKDAGLNVTSGAGQTIVGYGAGPNSGTGTGDQNTCVGYLSGNAITTGAKNTILGAYTGNQGGLDIRTLNNNIVLSDGDGNPKAYYGGSWNFVASANTIVWDSAQFYPLQDNTVKLGYPTYRWTTVYATTGTINTSDASQKQDITDLDNVEKRVAARIKSLIKKYRLKDSVAEKGDAARIHIGAVAQEVAAAFAAEGLDPARYAMFCSDTWYEVDGKSAKDLTNPYTAETEGAVEVTRLGLRYDELLAFVIAAM